MCSDCLGFAIDSVSQKVPYSEDTARLRLLCGSVEVGFAPQREGTLLLDMIFHLGFGVS